MWDMISEVTSTFESSIYLINKTSLTKSTEQAENPEKSRRNYQMNQTMSTKKTTSSTKAMELENKLLKENLSHALDALYGWPNHPASLKLKKVYDRLTKTVSIYASFQFFVKGKHTWSYQISKRNSLSKPITKIFIANDINMGFEDIKIDTVNVDGAYQYPFMVYGYNLICGSLQDNLLLSVPDKRKAPLNG